MGLFFINDGVDNDCFFCPIGGFINDDSKFGEACGGSDGPYWSCI